MKCGEETSLQLQRLEKDGIGLISVRRWTQERDMARRFLKSRDNSPYFYFYDRFTDADKLILSKTSDWPLWR